jgi:hypothetical protein
MGSNTMPPLDPNDDDDDDDDEEEDEEEEDEEDEEDEDRDEEPAVKNLITLARAWRHAATASPRNQRGSPLQDIELAGNNRRAGSASVSPKKN